MASPQQTVRDAWHRVAGAHAPHQLERLLHQYSQPHRHYHTVAHLAAVLDAIEHIAAHTPVGEGASDPEAVVLAALFHDAVYDPRSSLNEADSAELARACAVQLGWPAPRSARVAELVLATAGHVAPAGATDSPQVEGDGDEALLLDADLSILAAPPQQYRAYASAVRQEYAHVSDIHWRAGRAAVLRGFLQRDSLFRTSFMRQKADAAARANIGDELRTLNEP